MDLFPLPSRFFFFVYSVKCAGMRMRRAQVAHSSRASSGSDGE